MATRKPVHNITELPLDVDADNCLKVVLDCPEWEADVSNPSMPGGPSIRPKKLVLMIYPRQGYSRVWDSVTANVIGPRAGSTSARPRQLNVLFVDVLTGGKEHAPEWIQDQARLWVARLNGKV